MSAPCRAPSGGEAVSTDRTPDEERIHFAERVAWAAIMMAATEVQRATLGDEGVAARLTAVFDGDGCGGEAATTALRVMKQLTDVAGGLLGAAEAIRKAKGAAP